MKKIFVFSLVIMFSLFCMISYAQESFHSQPQNKKYVKDVLKLSKNDISSIYIVKYKDDYCDVLSAEISKTDDVIAFFNIFSELEAIEKDDSGCSVNLYFSMKTDDKLMVKYHPQKGLYNDSGVLSEKKVSSDEVIKIVEELGYEWRLNNAGAGPSNPGGHVGPLESIINGKIMVFFENDEICVSVNNNVVEFDDKPFIDENGRTQVPVRELCEFLNKKVYWYENPQRVAISTVPTDWDNVNGGGAGGDSIQFVIGESKYYKNGKEYPVDTAASIINNRTYIPLRVVGEFLNYEVVWQE